MHAARNDDGLGSEAPTMHVVLGAAVVNVHGRIDDDTVDLVLGALEFIRERNPLTTVDLSDVTSISDSAVKTLFSYQLEQEIRGGELTIVTPARLKRRLAVCHTVPASGPDPTRRAPDVPPGCGGS